MSDSVINFVCFFSAVISFCVALPYAKTIAIKIISDYKTFIRVRKVSNLSSVSYDEDEEDSESIGLNKKGPMFGANIFNYVADLDKDLINDMKSLLLKAGMRQENAIEEFMKSKFIAGISMFFIVFIVLTTNDFNISVLLAVCISFIAAVIGGHKLTNLNLKIIAEKRKDRIENGVPDLIDLLVICTESGLDLNRAIRRIAREMRTSNPTLADELSLTAIELEMIPDHKLVFQNLENRTNCLPIRTLSKTFSQSIEYGSSLAVSLRDLAVESRQRRMLNAEARAAQAPTLLTLPMMFFIMPCLFIVMLGPVITSMIRSFSGGG
jgi:tight adherence protein C